tara:strand:+ start:69764 stop:69970 length:207 start_codon:yes stop_codon:yes gene_type:complete
VKVILERYTDRDKYDRGYPHSKENFKSTTEALKTAKERISAIRGTGKSLGFKIKNKLTGETVQGLPYF